MNAVLRRLPLLVVLALHAPAYADDDHAHMHGDHLGKVLVPDQLRPEGAAGVRARAWRCSIRSGTRPASRRFATCSRTIPAARSPTWGIASILMSNPLAGQGASPKGAESAQAALEEGRRIGAKTERERDYIEAVAAYYQDFAKRTERERQVARAKAYEALAQRYPADDEAQIFFALYTAGTQTQADQTYAAYLKAAAILEGQFAKYPDHPGVAHYLIHSYDAPPIAAKGLVAARRYAGLAPDAPHALHMPSHIFTRVGAWQESAATNLRSREVARAGNEPDEAYHASDYMVYAYLQLARDAEARRAIDEAMKVQGTTHALRRAVRDRGDAGALRVRARRLAGGRGACGRLGSSYPFVESITYFARSVGAARSGDLAAARQDADQLQTLQAALVDGQQHLLGDRGRGAATRRDGLDRAQEGKSDEALRLMRAAADLEDRNEKHIVTPGRIVPARELLGDMLVELKQPAAALAEYEASQQREPNRFRNYSGSARAAEMAGDRAKAAAYSRKLLELTKGSDSARPELASARTLARR